MTAKTATPDAPPTAAPADPLEAALAAYGCDVAAAKARVQSLKGTFPQGVPEATLGNLIGEAGAIDAATRAVKALWQKWGA